VGVSDRTETLRREVLLLRGELAQERARGEAARIAFEAELADIEGAAAPLFQQFHYHVEGVPCIDCARQRRRPPGRHRYQAAVAGLPALLMGKTGMAWLATVVAGHPQVHTHVHTLLSTLPTPG